MDRSRPMILPALIAILALVLAACAGGAASPAAESEVPTPAESEKAAESEPAESEPAESEEAVAEEQVRIESSNFDPRELTIAVGTEVAFLNADGFTHTVTEGTDGQAVDDPIVDEDIEQNGTVRVTFDDPGTYEITCELHSSMQMTIIVEG
ncbi:MAG: plastocyanin/azurin family copper-binding protein [Candidatus Limnocylindria bacterium]